MIVSTIFSRRDCSVMFRLMKPTMVLTRFFRLATCVFALFSWVCIEEFWLPNIGISIADAVTALAAAANPSLRNSRLVWSTIRARFGLSLLLVYLAWRPT